MLYELKVYLQASALKHWIACWIFQMSIRWDHFAMQISRIVSTCATPIRDSQLRESLLWKSLEEICLVRCIKGDHLFLAELKQY